MAERASTGSRLPEEQLKEREKDGRVKRLLWDVLTLRMLAYVCAQPAAFTFIVSFLFITVSMPPMAAYIRSKRQLPDLDRMRSWNAYLGRLPDMKLCIEGEPFPHNLSSSPTSHVASAFIDFNVDSERAGQDTDMLIANFTGHDLRSKIKDSSTGQRIDHLVNITLYLPLVANSSLYQSSCTGCVDIEAPPTATPSRHPQIPYTDFTFKTRVLQSGNKPEQPPDGVSCSQYYREADDEELIVRRMTVGDKCKAVSPHKEKYRKHGLINIYLSQDQKEESYVRILLGTLGVAVIGMAFAVGIGCTERPPKPKNRPE